MPAPGGPERRRLKRVYHRIPAWFKAGNIRGEGHVKNLCKEGLFVRTANLPEPGSDVRVVMEAHGGDKVEVNGTVRWTTAQLPPEEHAQPGFGVLISPVPESFRAFFERVLVED